MTSNVYIYTEYVNTCTSVRLCLIAWKNRLSCSPLDMFSFFVAPRAQASIIGLGDDMGP